MLDRKIKIKDIEIEVLQTLDYSHAGSVWDGALVLTHYIKKHFGSDK